MKKTLTILIAAGTIFAAGSALADPRALSDATLETLTGEQGIALQGDEKGPSDALRLVSERDTEVKREIVRRNTGNDYPLESTDRVLTLLNSLQVGQASGKTFNDLMAEATPGRLPQFFIDEAQRVTAP
jgi:hypothetical protein